jgi:monoamine oxidase
MLNPSDVTTLKHSAASGSSKGAALLDILIIGGGLSGMMVANQIHRTLPPTTKWKLLEARPVLGGRLANCDTSNEAIDMGGAWIWPNHQPFMRKLAADKDNNITTFRQIDDPSSTRVEGGAVQFVHALEKNLPAKNIILNSPVTKCSFLSSLKEADVHVGVDGESVTTDEEPSIQVITTTSSGDSTETTTYLARRVVIAAPPKLVSDHIEFSPPLSKEKEQAMASSHTWMAGVTKISLVYPKRFWGTDASNMGFPSGKGPAFQVYDASPNNNSVAALTFFAMVPPSNKQAISDDEALASQVSTQLADVWNYYRLPYAAQAKSYTKVLVKRWPLEKYVSEDTSPTQIHPHPQPVRALSQKEWKDNLFFAGSETDQTSPGVMEGAVGAAMRVVYELQAIFRA